MSRVKMLVLAWVFVTGQAIAAHAYDYVTVFAAASMSNALETVDNAYSKHVPVVIRTSFASSSTLARQVEAGAPAQIFISADTKWMDYLAQKNLIENSSRKDVLGNILVLVAPRDARIGPRAIDSRLDWLSLLGANGHLAVGDPDNVPAGIYAKESLQYLGAWPAVKPRLARAENVRGALAMVERGDAPLGIVYLTDQRASTSVKIVGVFPASSHSPIVYPFAIVKGQATPAVQAYFNYLTGAEARAIFQRAGFSVH